MGLYSTYRLIPTLLLVFGLHTRAVADTYTYTPSAAGEAALTYVTDSENAARAALDPPASPVTKQQVFNVLVNRLLKEYIANAKAKQTESFLEKYKALSQADKDQVDLIVGAPAPR